MRGSAGELALAGTCGGLGHRIWLREGLWHVVSDFVGFFADVDVRAFEENRVQVGLSFVKKDCIGDVGSNVGGALAGESEPLEKDGFLLCRAVLDVLVPVVVALLRGPSCTRWKI